MHRLRNVLLLSFLLALGGTLVANGQEGTSVFDNSNQKSDTKQEKTKTKVKDNSGHRKHWYSLPHFFHKKHDKDSSASKSQTNPFDKPAASGKVASTESKPVATANQKTAATNTKTVATVKPAGKAVATTSSAGKTGGTASAKTVATAHPGTKKGTTARRHRKTVAGASQGKKTVRQDCTPEQAKKGGCTVDKAHSQKGSANPS